MNLIGRSIAQSFEDTELAVDQFKPYSPALGLIHTRVSIQPESPATSRREGRKQGEKEELDGK